MINITLTFAQQFDKETKRSFKNENVMNLVIDFSQSKFSGLDSLDFVTYYCANENRPKEYFGVVLKKAVNILKANLEKTTKKHFLLDGKSISTSFTYRFQFFNITEKGGMNGVLSVYPNFDKNNVVKYDFKIKDGRWNTFENLLYEAVEKLGKADVGISGVYNDNVYHKQKN